ncbi:MAG: hypothetical protein NTW28_18740, partial [Candidatus Solibacter sp.]|nr:hypothetical protein [Candidatus Solibacter sp.]
MTLLEDQPSDPVWRQRLVPCLQLAGILLSGWLMWRSAYGLQWERVSLPWLILRATVFAVTACGAGAAITLVLYLAASEWEREDVIRASLRASSAAVWFAPCVILLAQLSPAAAVPALVLVVNATHILYIQWRLQEPPFEMPRDTGLFANAQLPQRHFLSDFGPGLAVSFAVQTGACAVLLHHPVLAGFCLAAGAALATVFALATRAVEPKPPKSMPRAFLGLALTIVLAIGLTIGGMIPSFMRGPGGEGSASGNSPAGQLPGMPGGGRQDLPDAAAGDLAGAGGFPGVILWPEIKPIPTLIAPMPQTPDGGVATVMQLPLSIPFSGEYWMFRWPYTRPPKTSLFQRGRPGALSFSTTDRRPLQMEARHKLDQPVALGCCSAIRLEIHNADRYPGTISLELVLIDNEHPGPPSLSLGRYTVNSRPDVSRDPVIPVPETLEFPIPSNARLDAFNEFKVVFQRARSRADKSAKVDIDRF